MTPELTAAAFDSQTGHLVFGGHANQNLADAVNPGDPGVFKSFVGAVRLDDPLETFEYDFVPTVPGRTLTCSFRRRPSALSL